MIDTVISCSLFSLLALELQMRFWGRVVFVYVSKWRNGMLINMSVFYTAVLQFDSTGVWSFKVK